MNFTLPFWNFSITSFIAAIRKLAMKWFRKYSTYLAKMFHEMINKRLHQPGWYHLKKTSSTFNISWCAKKKEKKEKNCKGSNSMSNNWKENHLVWLGLYLVYIWLFSELTWNNFTKKLCFVLKIFIFFCIFDESTNFKICDAIIGIIAH